MRRLRDYRDAHAGETILVCGCGASLRALPPDLPRQRGLTTIGVNDVGRHFDPTYLVVLNPRGQFRGDRFRHVEASRAAAIFSQLDLQLRRRPGRETVRLRLGRRGGTDLSDPDRLPHTRNSPYVAVCLAAVMGARRIGLVGVDFTDHHFFADTGRHPLARQLERIDREYGDLAEALAERGVELVNLSSESRLTRLPKADLDGFLRPAPPVAPTARPDRPRRVFFVHYPFRHCGDVFERGLERAARSLGVPFAGASCNDPRLPARVAEFGPDLLFVVHGRTFRQRWRRDRVLRRVPSAVWLTDEPYEVDDSERTSELFDTVFVNDPATLHRHANAHHLPVAHDPAVHHPGDAAPSWDAGFVGTSDPGREGLLDLLAEEGLLSWVVGGPWRSRRLRRLCRAEHTTPRETADLYRRTRLVINPFRARHHYNRQRVAARSLNPRVYEALACGALVVTQPRPEVATTFPELPIFHDAEELVAVVRSLLADDDERRRRLADCRRRLPQHTYAARLARALELTAASVVAAAGPRHTEPQAEEKSMPAPQAVPPAADPSSIYRLEHRGPIVPGRVSVVVPVFDCPGRYLERSLASIREQELAGELELIVVDDGSSPRFRVAETARRHRADAFIGLPRNLGACAARNVGWLSAQGETTLFFDADDELEPHAVHTMMETLARHPEAALCYSDFAVDGTRFDAGPFDLETLLQRNRVAIAALVRTREFVGFDERVPRGMDWDAWLRMLKLGKRGVKAPGVLFHVTTERPGRISTTVSAARLRRTMRRLHPDLSPAPGGAAAARASRRAAARRRPRRQPAPSRPHAAERTIVTAVVVYQNSQPWLEVMLESLLRRRFTADPERVHLRVLLIENPCKDDSPRVAATFRERFGSNAAIVPSRLRHARRGGGDAHAHGLAVGLRQVKRDSEWTLFLDADLVLLRDGWLDTLLAKEADIVGPPAFAHLADPGVPHAHPSLLLFRTRLGRPPYWRRGFAPQRGGDGRQLDTAIAFTQALGRRKDIRLVQLPQEREVQGALEYYRIGDLALHLRGVSNLETRPARYSAKEELLNLPPVAELMAGERHLY